MSKGRKIAPGVASPLLLLCVVASALGLPSAQSSSNVLLQALTMLVSMVVVFFASHPLGHVFALELMASAPNSSSWGGATSGGSS